MEFLQPLTFVSAKELKKENKAIRDTFDWRLSCHDTECQSAAGSV
jgi:hypothetical protein